MIATLPTFKIVGPEAGFGEGNFLVAEFPPTPGYVAEWIAWDVRTELGEVLDDLTYAPNPVTDTAAAIAAIQMAIYLDGRI